MATLQEPAMLLCHLCQAIIGQGYVLPLDLTQLCPHQQDLGLLLSRQSRPLQAVDGAHGATGRG